MASGAASTYELQRQRIIEENKKRLLELGIHQLTNFNEPKPRKPIIPRQLTTEKRRSSRLVNHPVVSYREAVAADNESNSAPKRTRTPNGLLRRGHVPEALCNTLGEGNPSFVKEMLKSHTSGGFWLGLPSAFCQEHFRMDDRVTLEDEDGREWDCIYLHKKTGLSGGWRGFSLDHGLRDGDSVVFELVEPLRFKVQIRRGGYSPGTTGNEFKIRLLTVRNIATRDDYGSRQRPTLAVEVTDTSARQEKEVMANLMKMRSADANSEVKQDGKTSHVKMHSADASSEDKHDGKTNHVKMCSADANSEDKRDGRANHVKTVYVDRQLQLSSSSKIATVTTPSNFVSQSLAKPFTRAVKEHLQSYPEGVRPKAGAVCSLASTVSRKRIPTMFPVRKSNFVRHDGGKSVKVR